MEPITKVQPGKTPHPDHRGGAGADLVISKTVHANNQHAYTADAQ